MTNKISEKPIIKIGDSIEALASKNLVLSCSKNLADSKSNARSGHITVDSRQIAPGDIFIAYKGVTNDGHAHLGRMGILGAALLVVEDPALIPANCETPWIQVRSGREAWSFLCAAAFDNPQDQLDFIGITGTNGKTSCVWMIRALLRARTIPMVAVGTVGAYIGDLFVPTTHTTPDPPELYWLLSKAVKAGSKYCAMEVSSHAICQHKLAPIRFKATAFTSFSRDHLDFHKDMNEYLTAKLQLPLHLSHKDSFNLFCASLPKNIFDRLDKVGFNNFKLYSSKPSTEAYIQSKTNSVSVDGTSITVSGSISESREFLLPYLGQHSVENFCASLAICEKLLQKEFLPEEIKNLPQIPGRLEKVPHNKGPCVLVDYAHTPDALEKSLTAVKRLTSGRIVLVFGCGGDRDAGKRPQMGAIAAQFADFSFITNDNPRTEDPAAIANQIEAGFAGVLKNDLTKHEILLDRPGAIKKAIMSANSGDIVLIAGKGHEDYQIIGAEKFPMDDRLIAAGVLYGNME